mmetsp:Transcript_132246/g.257697  ORF Transcript_132246/g.257697 Transcript_132246/m.257697 type:complete len:216 (+) Transcript_132246:62-709(+)
MFDRHIVCTVVWLFLAIGLLAWQGSLRHPAQLWHRLKLRMEHVWLDPRELQVAIGIATIGTVLLAAIGYLSGFCQPGLPPSWGYAASQLVTLFFAPGLLEEMIFRGLLIRSEGEELPSMMAEHGQPLCSRQRPVQSHPPAWQLVLNLVIFVLYHLDVMHSQSFFGDQRFLVMAAVLGLCCQEAVIRTHSLWPGVLMHWLWVWGWLNFGSGDKLFL